MEGKNNWKAWLYLSPALILILIFTVYPLFNTIYISFQNGYELTLKAGGESFPIGIDNYKKVLEYPDFNSILINTVIIVFVTVPLSTFLALLIAVALNSIKPLQKIFQTIFFIPYVTNAIAIGMVFAMMFTFVKNPSGVVTSPGVVNHLLSFFGVDPVDWFGSSKVAKMFVLCFYIIWNALPFKILILVGALQGVGKQYYDAAKIDGTPRRRVFTKITVPLISPMIAYVLITGFIGAFKEYTSVVGIFGDNLKKYDMNTMVGFIYDSLYGVQTGRASAAAMILFLFILALTAVNMYVSKKKVHY